jgi:conserved domain protein
MNEIEKEIFGIILGEKKLEVILFLLNNSDENGFINTKISSVCNELNISKPTVIDTFSLLENKKIFGRVKNGLYKFKNLSQNFNKIAKNSN